MAIVTIEVEEVPAAGAAVLQDPSDDPAEALDALIGGYYDHSLAYLSKAMWRTAMAVSIEAPDAPFSQRFWTLDAELTTEVCNMTVLQRRCRSRADVPAPIVGYPVLQPESDFHRARGGG